MKMAEKRELLMFILTGDIAVPPQNYEYLYSLVYLRCELLICCPRLLTVT